jgi:predicted nuclease with TOPRIM domain
MSTVPNLLNQLKSAVHSSSPYEQSLLARVERVTRLAQKQKNELDQFLTKIDTQDLPSIHNARDVVEKNIRDHITAALKYAGFKNQKGQTVNPNIVNINKSIQKLAGMKRQNNTEAAEALEKFRDFLSKEIKKYNQKGNAINFESDQFGSAKDLSDREIRFQNALKQIKKELPWRDWFKVNNFLPMILSGTKAK